MNQTAKEAFQIYIKTVYNGAEIPAQQKIEVARAFSGGAAWAVSRAADAMDANVALDIANGSIALANSTFKPGEDDFIAEIEK